MSSPRLCACGCKREVREKVIAHGGMPKYAALECRRRMTKRRQANRMRDRYTMLKALGGTAAECHWGRGLARFEEKRTELLLRRQLG